MSIQYLISDSGIQNSYPTTYTSSHSPSSSSPLSSSPSHILPIQVCCIQTHIVRPVFLDEADEEVDLILSEECVEATGLTEDGVRGGQPLEAVLESFDKFLIAKGQFTLILPN